VTSIAANSQYFITVAESDDEMPISIWDSKSKMFLAALKSHESQVSKVIFLTDPNWMATSSWDCTVKIWNLSNILKW
jgi:WD40 repeat protein